MAEFAIYEKLDSLIAMANSEGHEGRECWSQELMALRNEIAAAWNRQVEGLNTQQAQCELQANRDEWMQRAFEIQSNLNAVIEDLRAAQGARESLQQQLAALQEERDELSSNLGMAMQAVENLQQQLAAAREALQAAEADAARYQWLRDNLSASQPKMDGNHHWYMRARGNLRGPSLDAAIDATLQRDRQP